MVHSLPGSDVLCDPCFAEKRVGLRGRLSWFPDTFRVRCRGICSVVAMTVIQLLATALTEIHTLVAPDEVKAETAAIAEVFD